MINQQNDKGRRWPPPFPTAGGVIAGLIPGLFALFTDVSQPFWVTLKIVLVVVAFGIAAANLIGLVIVRLRRSTKPDKPSP